MRRRALAATLGAVLAVTGASSAQAAPAWLAPFDLGTGSGMRLEVDRAGNAIAVWSQLVGPNNGANIVVRASTRPAGGSFSAPVDVSAKGLDAGGAQVAMDEAGNAIAVWRRGKVIQAATRPAGGSFSAPVDVSAQGHPTVNHELAMNAAGDAVVVWQQSDSATPSVKAATRPPGAGFSAPVDVSATGLNAQFPHVVVDPVGGAVVVWTRYVDVQATNVVIQTSNRPPGGGFAAPTNLSAPSGKADQAEVAVDAAGGAVAVWRAVNGTKHIVQAASRPPGGAFAGAVALSELGKDAGSPEVAANGAGDAVVVWAGHAGAFVDEIQAATRIAGGSFSAPVDLSGIDASGVGVPGGPSQAPKAAMDPAGNAVAVWTRDTTSAQTTQAATRPAGGRFSAPVDLSARDEFAFSGAQVTLDGSGDAVATWTGVRTGTSLLGRAAVYDATPPRLGGLSVPATGTVGVPVSFSVSLFDAWSPVAGAWSFGDGARGAGAATSHTYGAPGTYQVSVTATDAAGSPAMAAGRITIAPRPSTSQSTRPTTTAGRTNATARATISRLRLAPTAFRAVGRGASVVSRRVPTRTLVSYRLSAPASVTFTAERRSAGRRVGKRCAKPTKGNRGRRACVLYVKVRGSFTRRSTAGANRFSFTGRLQGRRLKPGSYRLIATPPAGRARGPSVRVAFRIVR